MEYRKALATILREQGVSQADLARRINKSRSYVSQLMSGRVNEPSLSIAFKIADALDVTVQDFIDLMKQD